jgi:hypothetical protein
MLISRALVQNWSVHPEPSLPLPLIFLFAKPHSMRFSAKDIKAFSTVEGQSLLCDFWDEEAIANRMRQ